MPSEYKTAEAVQQNSAVQSKSFEGLRSFLRKVGDNLSGHAAELRIASDPNTDVVTLKDLATKKFDYILEAMEAGKIDERKAKKNIEVLAAVEKNPRMLGVGLYSLMRRDYEIVINPD